jgi:hypothetical protein
MNPELKHKYEMHLKARDAAREAVKLVEQELQEASQSLEAARQEYLLSFADVRITQEHIGELNELFENISYYKDRWGPCGGSRPWTAAADFITLAQIMRQPVNFKFNGIVLTAYSHSDVEDIMGDYYSER